jgi:hypothetical protein
VTDLLSAESLRAAGFPTSPATQQRFLEDTTARRTARMELPVQKALAFLGGGALSLGGALLMLQRGDMTGLWAAGGSAVLHALLAGLTLRQRKQLAAPDGDAHPSACFRDERGKLRLRLREGERPLHEADADGPVRKTARVLAGAFQTSSGVVLGGVPIALAAGGQLSKPMLVLVALGTFLGTYVFGRGLMTLFGTKPVERVVLTNQRVAVLAAPGVAHSLPLDMLRFRPVVVGRGEGRATVALASRPLPATHPLPLPGLYGLHDVDEASAREWAGDLMDARKKLLSRG